MVESVVEPAPDASDAALLARFIHDHSQEAFAGLVERHAGLVRAVARSALGPHGADADDATQIVFILLARKAPTLRRPEALGSWLHTTARMTALHLKREAARRRQRERAVAADAPLEAVEPEPAQADHQHLHDGIAALSPKVRSAVILHYLEGRTLAQTAAALACEPEAAKKRLAMGLAQLRAHFTRHAIPAHACLALLGQPIPPAPIDLVSACARATLSTGAHAAAASALGAQAPWAAIGVALLATSAAAVAILLSVALAHHAVGASGALPAPAPSRDARAEEAQAPPPSPDPGARLVSCRYRRDPLESVLQDLSGQCGLWYALPAVAGTGSTVTIDDSTRTLRSVLERLADGNGMSLALTERSPGHPLAVFRRPALPTCGSALRASHAEAPDARLEAIPDLAQESDAEAVAALVRLCADPDASVAAAARRAVAERPALHVSLPQIGFAALVDAPTRAAVARAVEASAESRSFYGLRDALRVCTALGDDALARRLLPHCPLSLLGEAIDGLACASPPDPAAFQRLVDAAPKTCDVALAMEDWPSHRLAKVLVGMHEPWAERMICASIAAARAADSRSGLGGMRDAFLSALRTVPDPACAGPIVDLLDNPDANVRDWACGPLARMHDRSLIAALHAHPGQFVTASLQESHAEPATEAVALIARTNDPVALDAAWEALSSSHDDLACTRLIARCEASRAAEDGPPLPVDSIAVSFLAGVGSPAAADYLITLLGELPEPPPESSRWHYNRISFDVGVSGSVCGCTLSDEQVARIAALVPRLGGDVCQGLALWAPRDARWLGILTAIAARGHPEALAALGRLHTPQSRAALVSATADTEAAKVELCKGLGADASPAAERRLLQLLADPAAAVRAAVATGLLEVRDPATLPAIERAFARAFATPRPDAPMLAISYWREERTATAQALATLAGPSALDRLVAHAGDPDTHLEYAIALCNADAPTLVAAARAAVSPRLSDVVLDVARSEYPNDPGIPAAPAAAGAAISPALAAPQSATGGSSF